MPCILSEEEIGRLRNYDITPNCKHHKHVRMGKAMDQIHCDELEFFTYNGQQYLRRPLTYYLAVRPSGCLPVVQRVPLNRPLHIRPAEKYAKVNS